MTRALPAALALALAAPAAAAPPNVVVVIADDMAAEDCGAYGHPKVRTPNLDRLARDGVRFDRAFLTCSSCSPSRASILTGRYPHQTGAEQLHWPLPADQVMVSTPLRKAGYWTAAAGKWHLGAAAKKQFDVVEEGGGKGGNEGWVPLLRGRPKDKPFFVWLAATDPHRPYEPGAVAKPHAPADAVVPPYLPDPPAVRADLAAYYDEIARLDAHLGEVLDELDRQKVADDTVVVFLSDNGRPFPRCKTTVYDSGVRTPFVVRWPAKVKAGGVCGRLVSSVDLAPTVLGLAGLKPGPTFVGKDFAPLLADPTKAVREFVFAERNWHDYEARIRAVRSERFKLVRNDYRDLPNTPPADAVRSPSFAELVRLRDADKLTPPLRACFAKPLAREELYDVDADPHELADVSADPRHAAELGRLRAALAGWAKETDDRVPKERTPDGFDRETGKPLPDRKGPRLPPPDRAYTDAYSVP
ncbi:MAG: heparan N-sulfatase [Isosphaera sp.]|nr:heparan N-sulfatase [Isosphaera sp.]